jgi:di/tricarboxylate transporter
MNRKQLITALIPLAVWGILLLIPVPQGLQPNAWYYFALFAAVIVGLILEPVPGSIVGLIGIAAAAGLQLGSYSSHTCSDSVMKRPALDDV